MKSNNNKQLQNAFLSFVGKMKGWKKASNTPSSFLLQCLIYYFNFYYFSFVRLCACENLYRREILTVFRLNFLLHTFWSHAMFLEESFISQSPSHFLILSFSNIYQDKNYSLNLIQNSLRKI